MVISIIFGIIVGLFIYLVIRALFEIYDQNIMLNYVYALILFVISTIIFFIRDLLSKIFWDINFWMSVLITILVIAVLLIGQIYYVKMTVTEKIENSS